MNTTQFNHKIESLISGCLELTLNGASFADWNNYYIAYFKKLNDISDTRRALLSRVYRAQYSANLHLNTTFAYIKDNVIYVVHKPNNGDVFKAGSVTFRTTNDLHDLSPHLTQSEWDSMKRVRINKLTGAIMV